MNHSNSQKQTQFLSWLHSSQRSSPKKPGVYFFLTSKNEVLYIGKARNLFRRLHNYLSYDSLDNKTKILLSKASGLKYIVLDSDFEAILTEAELIRTHLPKYNFRLKDDKSPIYVLITKETYPRVLILRKAQLTGFTKTLAIFGPYQSAYQTKKLIRSIRKLFPFCNASTSQKIVKKTCFYYHLKLCPGACKGEISESDYHQNIENIILILRGKRKQLLNNLHKKMKNLAAAHEFEQAASYRDLYQNLVDLGKNELALDFFYGHQKLNIHKLLKNIWNVFSPYINGFNLHYQSFTRIEAYDVSNISGKFATASMVVYTDGHPDKNQYRRFRIRSIDQANDVLMLHQAISRRLSHLEWKLPQLILVDGGKTQVLSAKKALSSRGLHHQILVIGLAKKFEEIIIHKHKFHTVNFDHHSPELLFLIQIRDEAHRFAGNYHRFLRSRSMLENN